MAYIYFTVEQKHRANAASLVDYLRSRGEKLVRSGNEYRLVYCNYSGEHDSITIRGNEWYDHSAEEGGMAPKFLQRFYGMDYPTAVTELLGGETGSIGEPVYSRPEKKERKPFLLPDVNSDMRRAFAYLLKQRCIDPDVIKHFAHEKLLYESRELRENEKGGIREYHNLVFVGVDENGIPKHAHKRSLSSLGKSFRLNVEGSDPGYSFHHVGTSDRLYVFEAPIDMLSYISLNKEDWQHHSYVALCGVSEQAMLKLLELHPHLQKVVLCVDHDERGIEALGRLTEILTENGYSQIESQLSEYKDWNEDIKASHGLYAISAQEHPQFALCDAACKRLANQWQRIPVDQCIPQRMQYLFEQVHFSLHWGRFDETTDYLEKLAVTALKISQNKYRQAGEKYETEQLLSDLNKSFRPHKNRSHLKSRLPELGQTVSSLAARRGPLTQKELLTLAGEYENLSLECVMAVVRVEADQKQQEGTIEKEETEQPEQITDIAMA